MKELNVKGYMILYLLRNEDDPFPEYIKKGEVLKLYIICYLLCITRAENKNIFDLLVFAQRNPGRINEQLIKVEGWCRW